VILKLKDILTVINQRLTMSPYVGPSSSLPENRMRGLESMSTITLIISLMLTLAIVFTGAGMALRDE
jgi:hypothetical protein